MLETTVQDPRAEAKLAGLRWRDVAAAARELRAAEIRKREPLDRARRLAWESYCHWNNRATSCLSFWRCGFDHVLGRYANSGRDYTAIRHYDQVASAVAEQLPEWQDRADELWELLAERYEPLPGVDEFYNRAIDWLLRLQRESIDDLDEEF